jgi:hypothetical protein
MHINNKKYGSSTTKANHMKLSIDKKNKKQKKPIQSSLNCAYTRFMSNSMVPKDSEHKKEDQKEIIDLQMRRSASATNIVSKELFSM